MTRTLSRLGWALVVIWIFTLSVEAQVKVTIDRNPNSSVVDSFKFKNVPSPVRDDAAVNAKLTLVEGQLDGGSAGIIALIDGVVPTDEDQPGSNFYFRAGSFGGRIRVDLANVIEVSQINSYSWHPNTRGPQLYKVYGSDGTDPKFTAEPKRPADPAMYGWKLIATVSTVPMEGEQGGQYGVSITDERGVLGKYRYLLFDCYPTEINDNSGNTFYSEIDVVGKKSNPQITQRR